MKNPFRCGCKKKQPSILEYDPPPFALTMGRGNQMEFARIDAELMRVRRRQREQEFTIYAIIATIIIFFYLYYS